jgi:superfamily II DNA helicase RecQ
MIFSDRTLYDLIAKKPAGEAALLGVFGMGEVKVHRFGRDILEAMAPEGAQFPSAHDGPSL